jgi:2-polyprenyl-6-methoxyphenol hydroxylase-like FAD-dependent oxidoreductase
MGDNGHLDLRRCTSAFLGQMKVPNVILEQEPDITTDPRGIALDEDGIRMLQAVGVYDQIYTDIGRSTLEQLLEYDVY